MQILLERQIAGTLSPGEALELRAVIADGTQRDKLVSVISGLIDAAGATPTTIDAAMEEVYFQQIVGIDKPVPALPPVHRVDFLRTAWFRYAAAAIIIMTIGAYLWTAQHRSPDQVVTNNPVPVQNDVAAPTTNRSTITLSDGKQVVLDGVVSGTLDTESGAKIQVKDGSVVYQQGHVDAAMVYNTLTVPRGSQVASIILADGSKVTLNAASTLCYPVAFTGKERRVEMTGEAYFEVTKDSKKKFSVVSNGIETEVLGTHFNINAYPEEDQMAVTLLEGRVTVRQNASSLEISPGQQVMSKNQQLTKNTDVDLQQVMAWKNGKFQFGNGMEITAILRQVSRWYDVEIKYDGEISRRIGGSLPRQVNVSKVLDLLKSTGSIDYRIKGKKVIISPSK